MTLRSDISRAKELDAKAGGSIVSEIKHYRELRPLVPRLIEQMERMEGALERIADFCNGYGDEAGMACKVARSALAELDKE